LVPVLCVWLLKPAAEEPQGPSSSFFGRMQSAYGAVLHGALRLRWPLVAAYLALPVLLAGWWLVDHPGLGTEIFPAVDAGQVQLRLRAPDGTTLEDTEALARDVLEEIGRQAGGPENVDISVSLVGTASYNYPINSIYLWTSGSQEAVLRIALRRGSGVRVE